ncbi:MAG: hypothetical protein ACRDPE_15175 [Solirubrobacterales bacterium]
MAWGTTDIARSIRRYLTLMWDKDSGWTTRIARRVVADDERPVAVILLGDAVVTSARRGRNQGNVTEAWPVTIYAYPPIGEDEQAATVAADAIRDQLRAMIVTGLAPADPKEKPSWLAKAGPFVLPLWDYAGVPLEGPERGGPADPHDVIWVDESSLTAQNLEDPQDGKRRTVVLEFRISIERPGRIVPEGPVVGSMPGQYKPLGSGHV